MARIKVTGYLDTREMYKDYVDLLSPTGLTKEGCLSILYGDERIHPVNLSDLDDLEMDRED